MKAYKKEFFLKKPETPFYYVARDVGEIGSAYLAVSVLLLVPYIFAS